MNFTTPTLSSSDWAAWVQAIGSIAAIGSVFVLLDYQQRREQQANARTLLAITMGVLSLTFAEARLLKEGDDKNTASRDYRNIRLVLKAGRDLIASADLSKLHAPLVWLNLTDFLTNIDLCADALEQREIAFASVSDDTRPVSLRTQSVVALRICHVFTSGGRLMQATRSRYKLGAKIEGRKLSEESIEQMQRWANDLSSRADASAKTPS